MKIWTRIKVVLIFMICVILLYNFINIGLYIMDGLESNKLNNEIEKLVNAEDLKNNIENHFNTIDKQSMIEAQHDDIYRRLAEVNDDAVGWITISNTDVDYLVVQAEDNEYYLNRNLEKESSIRGSIFMDWRTQAEDSHIIVYGHNMRDGSMFGNLKNYANQEYYQEHKMIGFHMYGKMMQWEIFSVSYSSNTLLKIDFDDVNDYSKYLNKLKTESLYDTKVEVSSADRILTLSTCSDKFYNARLVIHAKLITEE